MAETRVTITLENLAPDNGIGIAQTWYAFHDGTFDLYDTGATASQALEIIAEDGITGIEQDIPGLVAEAIANGANITDFPAVEDTVAGQFAASEAGTNGGIQGMLFTENREPPFFLLQNPGETVSATITIDDEDIENNRYFSYVTKVFPSNDGFIANDDPQTIEVFDESGNFVGANLTITGDDVLDAGTEVNDEDPENIIYELENIGNGVDEDGTIGEFPDFQDAGEGGIVDFELDGETIFANADFTVDDYQIARLTIEEAPVEPDPIEVTVTIENLAPEAGIFLTPFWVGFHDGDFDTYDRGRPISPGLESLVEDGINDTFSNEFALSGDGTVDGNIVGEEGTVGPIDPGEITSQTFSIDANADTSQFFSYASMVIPSNDAFIANGNPTAHSLFDEEGNFVGADFIIPGSAVLDGGTEVNDEEAETTAFFSQDTPDTGEDENGVVTTHPGFIEDGRILTEDGTTEGAPAAFTNADFTAEDYQVARITVSVGDRPKEPVNLTATLSGEQEVDGGDEDASGTSTLTLNDTGDALEYSLTVTGLDFGANGLIEGGATTEDTSDDVTRLHIHNAPSGENGDVVFSLFDTVAPELGNVLDITGNQDEDLVVTVNDDGSVTLTGVWEESDPATTALSEFVPDIRAAEAGSEVDLYWNVHTTEFPAGAIRGQLEVAEEPPEPVNLTATLDGEQEVDGGDEDASGTSTLTLNETGDALEYSLTVTGLDFGANGLIEGGATTEDTSDDVTRLHIHNAASGENGDVVFSLFDTVAPELGNVLDISGNQDEDLVVTANDDGSVTLTGVWEESDPATTALSEFVSEIRETGEDEPVELYWNVHTTEFPAGAIRGQLVVDNEENPPEPDPIEVTVTIENLAPDGGTFLTPFWVGFHDGDFDTYDRGRPISPGLERLVEDGNTDPLSDEFILSGDGTVDGTVIGSEGAEGPIDPGETATQTFTIDANADTSEFFSYASMIIPSNDAFVANGNPTAHSLFDEEGNFIGADFIIPGSAVLDGGTEVNDEEAETTAFFFQEEADTGETENGVVTTHPGFIEDGRILTEDGTTEDAPAAFNNADFTADGYQVARVTVSIVDDPVSLTATLNGEQEVDGGDEDASGTSTLTLNETGNALEYSLTVTGLDFGANGLIEGGATTEDTSDDVTRLHIHNAPSGANGDVVFSLFDTVAPELGNVLDIPGNQDEDLTITENDDGSVTLTGVWEGTDPANTNLSEFVSEIRNAEPGSEVDLYWNVHTTEFPAGAIRGQLEVEEEEANTIDLFRFRNLTFDTGTYIFVGEEERDVILNDENLSNIFALDGVEEDGTINPAFTASTVDGEGLIPFFRLESLTRPGTFLFVSTAEYEDIFAEDSNQRDQWLKQGFDESGEVDIPEFFLFDSSEDRGLQFTRFQNNENATFLFAGPEETQDILGNPDLNNAFTNQNDAFESLIVDS